MADLESLKKTAIEEAVSFLLVKHVHMTSERAEERARNDVEGAVKAAESSVAVLTTFSPQRKVEYSASFLTLIGVSKKTAVAIALELVKESRG